MELVFLGNGGGRIVLDKQMLPTGGFRINSPKFRMHVDPGPGALLKCFEHGQDPASLDALFVSHAHIDHCNDANMLAEAMNFGNYSGKKGVLLGSGSVVNGHGKFEKQIDEYFKDMLKDCRAMKAGEEYRFGGEILLKATRTLHEDPSAIGFVLGIGGLKLGYTSDTDVFDGFSAEYEGCDFMVFNCLRPSGDKLKFHFCSNDVVSAVNAMVRKPRAIFITHLGLNFLRAGKDAQKKLIQENAGVETVIAQEGLKINLLEMKKQGKLI